MIETIGEKELHYEKERLNGYERCGKATRVLS